MRGNGKNSVQLLVCFISYLSVTFNLLFAKFNIAQAFMLIALGVLIGYCYKHKLKIDTATIKALAIMAICWTLSICFSSYSPYYSIVRFAYLFFLIIFSANGLENTNSSVAEPFYWVFFVCLLINIIVSLAFQETVLVFSSLEDKNFTAVLIYLFFLLSNKLKHYGGIILTFLYLILLSTSRSMLLMIVLFYFFQIVIIIKKKNNGKILLCKKLWKLFIIMFAFICVFSFIWVFYISAGTLSGYHESLNDGSNRMRFVANIKAMELFTKPYLTWFWGFGNKLTEYLGISSTNLAEHTHYLGVRLVQPHNCFFNMFLKIGIFPGIIYFTLLAKLLDRFNTVENIPYLLPYLINTMFMHSLLDGNFLMFWIFILAMPKQPYVNVLGRKCMFIFHKHAT